MFNIYQLIIKLAENYRMRPVGVRLKRLPSLQNVTRYIPSSSRRRRTAPDILPAAPGGFSSQGQNLDDAQYA